MFPTKNKILAKWWQHNDIHVSLHTAWTHLGNPISRHVYRPVYSITKGLYQLPGWKKAKTNTSSAEGKWKCIDGILKKTLHILSFFGRGSPNVFTYNVPNWGEAFSIPLINFHIPNALPAFVFACFCLPDMCTPVLKNKYTHNNIVLTALLVPEA